MEEENKLAQIVTLPVIEQHFREISKDVKERTERAMSVAVTEDNLIDIKKIRAELNKEFTQYETVRKQIKKKIMEKYDEFNLEYEELIASAFKTADDNLKAKINDSEYKIKAEREKELKTYFEELRENKKLENIILWEQLGIKINLSDSDKKIMKQIKEKLDIIESDIKVIELEQNSGEIMAEYLKDFNYARAKLTVVSRIAEAQRLDAARLERENKIKQEEEMIEKVEDVIKEEIPTPAIVETVDNSMDNSQNKLIARFEVTGSKEELIELRNYMNENNLEFKSI